MNVAILLCYQRSNAHLKRMSGTDVALGVTAYQLAANLPRRPWRLPGEAARSRATWRKLWALDIMARLAAAPRYPRARLLAGHVVAPAVSLRGGG